MFSYSFSFVWKECIADWFYTMDWCSLVYLRRRCTSIDPRGIWPASQTRPAWFSTTTTSNSPSPSPHSHSHFCPSPHSHFFLLLLYFMFNLKACLHSWNVPSSTQTILRPYLAYQPSTIPRPSILDSKQGRGGPTKVLDSALLESWSLPVHFVVALIAAFHLAFNLTNLI